MKKDGLECFGLVSIGIIVGGLLFSLAFVSIERHRQKAIAVARGGACWAADEKGNAVLDWKCDGDGE